MSIKLSLEFLIIHSFQSNKASSSTHDHPLNTSTLTVADLSRLIFHLTRLILRISGLMTDHLMSSANRSDRLLGNNIIRGNKLEGITIARGARARVVPLLNDLLMVGWRAAALLLKMTAMRLRGCVPSPTWYRDTLRLGHDFSNHPV